MADGADTVPPEQIERSILFVRGRRVMLDAQLAELYGVETRALVQAVKRNVDRFPHDFMFQLSQSEGASLRSQTVITKQRGGRRYRPIAFTEQGVAMLSSVLRSKRAVQVNIAIMRAFVHMRRMIEAHEELSRRIDELEARFNGQFKTVFEAIRSLMARPEIARTPIGFKPEN
jgi:hypothetical protein